MSTDHATVAIYQLHTDAEAAVRQLQHAGFDLPKLSIVGRDYHTENKVVGYYNAGDRIKYWGTTGAFWGGIWGVLFGSAFFLVPGLGPLLVAGPLVAFLLGAMDSAVLGGSLSVVATGLHGLGIPGDSALRVPMGTGNASANSPTSKRNARR